MIYFACAVRDSMSGTFGRPFFEATEMTARRSIALEVNNDHPSNVVAQNPGDFELYFLGNFDDSTGLFSLLDIPRSICNLKELVREKP